MSNIKISNDDLISSDETIYSEKKHNDKNKKKGINPNKSK